jgi:hypothetical protein
MTDPMPRGSLIAKDVELQELRHGRWKPSRNRREVRARIGHLPNSIFDVCQSGEMISGLRSSMVEVHQLPEKWLPISIAPSDINLEVGVMDKSDVHALIFPVRKRGVGWVDALSRRPVDIEPTHWRVWHTKREF